MKHGYSILLGEVLGAEVIEYEDCKNLQVVCPECREPVFKGFRQKDSKETHYLSHYDKKISYRTDCENRVGGITDEVIQKDNKRARGQRLKLFMSVLKNLLSKSPIYTNSIELSQRRLERSASFCVFRDLVYKGIRNVPLDEIIEIMKMDYRYHLSLSGWAIATTFPIQVQERIASDMYRTLVRPIARKNLDYLFTHSYMMVLQGYGQPGVQRSPDENFVIDRITYHLGQIATQRKKRQANQVVAAMASEYVPPGFNKMEDGTSEDNDPSSYFMRIAGNIQTEMYQVLVELPYYEVLHSEYTDPSKDYPYVSGIAPVSDEEKKRVGFKLH